MASRKDLVKRLGALQHRLVRTTARYRSDAILASNLTMQQVKILTLVAMEGPLGGNELARMLNVSMATVTGIVDRLVDKDLVSRSEDPSDRRVRRVELTEQGLAIVGDAVTGQHMFVQDLVARLTDEDLEQCVRTFTRIVEIMDEIDAEERAKDATRNDAEEDAPAR